MDQLQPGGLQSTPNNPWYTDNIYQGFSTESVSETLNLILYEKDASGSTVIAPLTSRRVFDRMGGKLGTFWGDPVNQQYKTNNESNVRTVVLTDTSATVEVYDSSVDLEKIFESQTKARYVLRLIDRAGKAYYGFIGGVSVSSNVYTFSIYSEVTLSTQTWLKTYGSGIAAPYNSVEIYEYTTSLEFDSATTFTEEVVYNELVKDFSQLKDLTDGQYIIDYRRGRLLGRKADGANTIGVTYIGTKSGNTATEAAGDVAHDAADSGKPVKFGGHATAADRTDVDESDRVDASFDLAGYLRTLSTSQGDIAHDAVDANNPVKMGARAESAQITAVAAADRTDLIANLYGELVLANHTWASQSGRTEEINPIDTKNQSLLQVDVTNETNATNNRRIDVRNYSVVKVQFTGVGGTDSITHTVEASCEDNGTAIDSAVYDDISEFGITALTQAAAAASYTADITYEILVKGFSFINLKTVSAGGANDGDYSLLVRGAY